MAAKRGGKDQISGQEESADAERIREAIKHEMARASGAMDAPLLFRVRDLNRIAESGMNAAAKIAFLSQNLLPVLCDTIQRGLTFEELRLLAGTSEKELRAALRRLVMKNVANIVREKADRDEWVNIEFIIKEIRNKERDENAVVNGERMLAPAKAVRTRSHYRRFKLVSGAMPELYSFRSPWLGDAGHRKVLEQELDDNRFFLWDGLVTYRSMLSAIRPMMAHPHAHEISKHFALFFHEAHKSAVHYAHRYRFIDEEDTFQKIVSAAAWLDLGASSMLEFSELLKDAEQKRLAVEHLDAVILDTQTKIDELTLDAKPV